MQSLAVLGLPTLMTAVTAGVLWYWDSMERQPGPLDREHPTRLEHATYDRELHALIPHPSPTSRTRLETAVSNSPRVLVRGRIRTDAGPPSAPSLELAAGLEAVVHSDGRFEVRGQCSGSNVCITATAEGCREWWRDDVPVGTNDLDILLVRVELAAVEVRVDPALVQKHPLMRFDLIDREGLRWGGEVVADESDSIAWYCVWDALPLGRYRLEVRPFTAARPTLTLDNLNVVADKGFDPKPRALDLRGRLQCMQLSLRGPTGTPLGSDFYFYGSVVSLAKLYRDQWGVWRDTVSVDKDGCSLVTADVDGLINVCVESSRLVATYCGPCTDVTLTMHRKRTTSICIPELPRSPPHADWTIRFVPASGEGAVHGRGPGSDPPWLELLFADLDDVGWCNLALTPKTRYRIDLLLSAHRGQPGSTETLPVRPPTIEVGDSPPCDLALRIDSKKAMHLVKSRYDQH